MYLQENLVFLVLRSVFAHVTYACVSDKSFKPNSEFVSTSPFPYIHRRLYDRDTRINISLPKFLPRDNLVYLYSRKYTARKVSQKDFKVHSYQVHVLPRNNSIKT